MTILAKIEDQKDIVVESELIRKIEKFNTKISQNILICYNSAQKIISFVERRNSSDLYPAGFPTE